VNQQSELIVIDNETQDIFVNGKKWERSPLTYMHLARRPATPTHSPGIALALGLADLQAHFP
jgi:hypothetical protein